MRVPLRSVRAPLSGLSVAIALGVALAPFAVACHDAPPTRTAPTEVPFQLAPADDEPDADTSQVPTEIPPPGAEEGQTTTQPTPVEIADPSQAGVEPCPSGNGPSDLIVRPEPARRGADAGGAGGVVRVELDNRRSIPRTVEVVQVDRLDGVPGAPLKIARVSADEGGGGLAESKMMLAAQATLHLVVEFDPSVPPPYRVRFKVDDELACIDSPAAPGVHKARAPKPPRAKAPRGGRKKH